MVGPRPCPREELCSWWSDLRRLWGGVGAGCRHMVSFGPCPGSTLIYPGSCNGWWWDHIDRRLDHVARHALGCKGVIVSEVGHEGAIMGFEPGKANPF